MFLLGSRHAVLHAEPSAFTVPKTLLFNAKSDLYQQSLGDLSDADALLKTNMLDSAVDLFKESNKGASPPDPPAALAPLVTQDKL